MTTLARTIYSKAAVAFLVSGGSLALMAKQALAQATWSDASGLTETAGAAGLGSTGRGLDQIIGSLIGALISILGVVFILLLVYGGFVWMTAQGNEDKIKKAKNIVSSAVIGLVVVFLSYAIAQAVVGALSSSLEGGGGEITNGG